MNCYTRKEKFKMALEDIGHKVKMTFDICLIILGIVALMTISYTCGRIKMLENQIEQMEESKEEEETKVRIVDTVTGRVIYEE